MKALLFDLDDTLLDYSEGVDAHWQQAVRAHAPAGADAAKLVDAVAEARRWFWDDPARHRRERVDMLGAWQHIVEFALARLQLEADGLAPAIARDFAARRRAAMRLFPDALESLERFRRRSVPLGLVTNGDATMQRDKIERYGLAPFFGAIVIEGEFGAGKPDAIVYREALALLGAAPDAAWMVGDHLEFDVEAPQALGLKGVWVDREGRGLPAGSPVRPHQIVRSLRDLT